MSQLSRVWMAASVAVVQGHTAEGSVKSSALRSLHRAAGRLASASPAAVAAGLGIGRAMGGAGGEDRRKQADDSLRKAMYISCWAPS
ncbi:hypothetical protein Cni_G00597 [Canna indica]|uniref:Uncharacterized protein n=1 Tax=Canna indica TaxID=4628 RepID=A0AAQ3JLJ7_9LILI|nr:hypothetical protein Cni_G00597 [Canna indica]